MAEITNQDLLDEVRKFDHRGVPDRRYRILKALDAAIADGATEEQLNDLQIEMCEALRSEEQPVDPGPPPEAPSQGEPALIDEMSRDDMVAYARDTLGIDLPKNISRDHAREAIEDHLQG